MDSDPLRAPVSTGWFPDPLRRFELRYYNGERWTADVAVDGTRYVDPGPFAPPPAAAPGDGPSPQRPSPPPHGRHPSRSLAVLAFSLGLAGVVLGWTPFLFVLGAGASVAAIVLGTKSLRRTTRLGLDAEGSGRALAIAGLCLAPVGLALCVVGVMLTGFTYREFDDYTHPGPYRIGNERCVLEGRDATYSGTITNLDDRRRDYELYLQYLDPNGVVASDRVRVDDVAAGATAVWSSGGRVGDIELTCRVRSVTGPFPFGLDRD